MMRTRVLLLVSAALSNACIGPVDDVDYEPGEQVSDNSRPITAGTPATQYPEAVMVDMPLGNGKWSICTGSVIAPKVVLTAGHCVVGKSQWKIKAPYAGGQTAASYKGVTYDYTATTSTVPQNQHDIGLVLLETPIQLETYPKLAGSVVPQGTLALNVGRKKDGQSYTNQIFVSKPLGMYASSSYYPLSYQSTDYIDPGDSGGPVVLQGSTPHTIIAVNSAAGGGKQFLARVDLVLGWINGWIAKHGGPGDTGSDPGPKDPPADPCQGYTYQGACLADGSVVWCENAELQKIACQSYGASCTWNSFAGFYDCAY